MSTPLHWTILIADDFEDTRESLKLLFEMSGYRVLLARDGREAWDQIQLKTVDLLITDLQLPNLSGFDLIKNVRGREDLKLPIVVISGSDRIDLEENGLSINCDEYLVKPLDFDSLLILVDHLLRLPSYSALPLAGQQLGLE
jgi:DNA-binding response OmpR family regulator